MYNRTRSPRLFGAVFLFFMLFAGTVASAQEQGIEGLLKDRAVVLDINAQVVEQNRAVVWKEAHQRVTINGRSVGLRLVGVNVVVVVQFTPYIRAKGQSVLVAQGQVWAEVPNQGIRYQTSIQTIPMEFDEMIYFFPLGSVVTEDSPRIEIQITLKQNRDSAPSSGMPANAPRDNR
jgi:hypothetical protein